MTLPSPIDEATRQAAYDQLLGLARVRDHDGTGSTVIRDALGRADLGRAEHSAGLWATRNNAMQASGQAMLAGTSAALTAARGRRGSGVGRGGGGSGQSTQVYAPYAPSNGIAEYLAALAAMQPVYPRHVAPGSPVGRGVYRS